MVDARDTQMPDLPFLRGTYRIASRVTGEAGRPGMLPLGVLRVFPATPEADSPSGQWIFWIDASLSSKAIAVLIEVTTRLGLVPVHFSSEFETHLRAREPLCLVADTNTLYHGSLGQALTLRRGAATHVAIADQVLMELQKQREVAYVPKKKASIVGPSTGNHTQLEPAARIDFDERWCRAARRATLLAAGGRALRRIRATGHIVHVARPPDAMVRYFGGGRHAGEDPAAASDEDPEIVGSNALRDRLILEAAIRQRVALPGVSVWLMTDDALLAAQATLEGLSVGFAWLPAALDPPVLTSPYFSCRTLQLQHIPIEDFLDELLWSTGNLLIQREGETRAYCARIPEDRRARVLSEISEPGHHIGWSTEDTEIWSLAAGVPQKAPPPADLVATLIRGLDGRIPAGDDEPSNNTLKYLRALGWADADGALTARGHALAELWQKLDYDQVDAWAAWLDDAGRDVRKLRPIAAAIAELRAFPGATDADVAKRLAPTSSRSIGAQLGLASAFGILVRLGTKGREAAEWTSVDAEQAILNGIRSLLDEATPGVAAVNLGKLFTFFQRKESRAMPFHVFRRALVHLEGAGRIVFSGSNPDSDPVVIHVLMPSSTAPRVALMKVNLGSGSHIVTGQSAKVVQLQEVTG